MKAVFADNISLSYGGKQVLHNLSLTINREEFFIIIGPNGAGKSTLLKALTATEKINAGSISLFGRPQNGYSRREMAQLAALVPQGLDTNFPFRVADTVLMGRSPHLGLLGIEQEEDYQIARQAMQVTDTAQLADRTLDQLSGGERQRVIIARAICQQPSILFLDEPTAALDLAHQVRIMDLLENLRRERKITICMISHDINLAAMYADRLLLMKDGRVVATGNPDQVLEEKLLEESYGCRLLIDKNPVSGTRRVLPLPAKFTDTAGKSRKKMR
ncbi:MAG: heme ABC transporter ATP-binding protein [Proteobacteria bacterium]|nr:heme ABC transporter ATP-binding protein [Pseudomonadota bacterium]MBU0966779.1 heme ABC transporter ATP-binding protein [Pseudomonadota bacterium]